MEDEQQFQQGDGITKSTFNDIVNTLGAEEAKKIIAVMRKDPNAQVIERAQVLFPVVPLATIKQILGKNKFKLQLCIDELERENERVAKKKKEEEMKKRELQLAKQREEDLKKVINQFHQISKEEITRIFKEAGQDIRKTVVKIKSLLKEKLKKEAQERARSAVKFKLHQQFSQLDSKLIDFTIEQQDYNLEKATVKLNEIAHEMIVDNLFNSVNGQLQKEQLFKMLQENNWNQTEAYKVALQCIEEKKKEEVPKEVMQSLKDEERTQSLLISSALENEITNEVAEGDKQVTSEIASTLQNILEPQGENAQKGEEKGDKPTVSVEKVNEKVVAKVNFPCATRSAWVGFYKSESPDNQYITYNWLCYAKNNTLEFDAPKINGKYQVRVFSYKYNKACASEDLVLDVEDKLNFSLEIEANTVTVSWVVGSFDPFKQKAYVTVHKVEEDRYNYYRRYNWCKTFEGQHKFKKLVHAGDYEARLYIGRKCILKSKSIAIPGI